MPSTKLPLRVAILCSHRAPALRHLLEQGSNRRRLFEVVACLTSEESFAEEDLVRKHGIPLLTHSLRRFCVSYEWRLSNRTADGRLDLTTIAAAPGKRPTTPFELDEDGRVGAWSVDDTDAAALLAMVR